MSLNRYDLSILGMLQKNSKVSLTSAGEMLGLSRFAVKARMEKLFRNQVILGSTIVVNPFLVGIKRTAFFELKTNPHEPWLAGLLEEMRSCDILNGITGEYSLLGRFKITGDEHFGQILKRIDEAMARSFFKKYHLVNIIHTYKESGVPFEKETGTLNLDNTDLKILEILLNQTKYAKTPRPLSTTQISRLLHNLGIKISQPAVSKRLMRLESRGVILRHTIMVDPMKLDIKTKVIVRIKVYPASYDHVARSFLAQMNEITDLYRTGEDYGLLAIAMVKDVSQYNSLLLKLYTSKDIIDTYTVLVLEERKKSRLPLMELRETSILK
jgi:Lrp/AsnC family leucine-responsive transcriptional regulator